jgi:pSer/pThr/pTyr-binding forkhead associated (FHA) protein
MPLRLVPLDHWPEILVDPPMIIVGRDPSCDARLDSIRVSRRHCCMIPVRDELEVKDLGSKHGIWINDRRVKTARLRPGDELVIAHIRYMLDGG